MVVLENEDTVEEVIDEVELKLVGTGELDVVRDIVGVLDEDGVVEPDDVGVVVLDTTGVGEPEVGVVVPDETGEVALEVVGEGVPGAVEEVEPGTTGVVDLVETGVVAPGGEDGVELDDIAGDPGELDPGAMGEDDPGAAGEDEPGAAGEEEPGATGLEELGTTGELEPGAIGEPGIDTVVVVEPIGVTGLLVTEAVPVKFENGVDETVVEFVKMVVVFAE